MYDKGKIVFGLLVFVLVVASPWLWTAAKGKGGGPPELQKATMGTDCVIPAETMREKHMDLLNDWRDEYVREQKIYVHGEGGEPRTWKKGGEKMLKSLSNTCLRCHTDKVQFCDKCHDYAGVDPYCWDCHVVPTGRK